MLRSASHTKIYRTVVDLLESAPLVRKGLIEKCLSSLGLSADELRDKTLGSVQNNLRSRIGTVINEMHAHGLIALDESGRYYLVSARPVIIRIERCETEILKALAKSPLTKNQLKSILKNIFGTDKTATTKDDDTLATYMGQILKRFTAEGAIIVDSGYYKLSPKLSAKKDDISALLTLKSDFLARLHAKGGEFFESYFMTLLKKYLEKHGKKVIECYVTGGSDDSGIDGVIKTEDSLGFREVIMVQTKNRIDIPSETDVRGFYGAVCAKRGTRGIYATTSDFHSGAKKFLDALDDCIGINGERIFAMAAECAYGIKKHGESLEIDFKVI